MAWHVLSSTYFDFARFERESAADRLPGHLLPRIAERLDATIHQPGDGAREPSRLDRLSSHLYGQPMHWELARRTLGQLRAGDAVYAAGCDSGVPLALACALRRRRVDFAIAFIDVRRRRSRLLGWLLVLLRLRLLILVPTEEQAVEARRSFGRRAVGVDTLDGQTDTRFFRPNGQPRWNEPPLVGSSGVEQRDYATLGAALESADVRVEVSFVSPNRTDKTRFTLPDPEPANMEFRQLDFVELRSLYQTADVVVLPLRPNRYSAGLTALFEAIACEVPIVVTHSTGIVDELIDEGLVLGVEAGDPGAIRSAVDRVLDDPLEAAARAAKARQVLLDRYSAGAFLARLDEMLRRLRADDVRPRPLS